MADLNDPEYLKTQQYGDAGNLNARAALGPEARILEVGCGPAQLWRRNLNRLPTGWRVTLTEFSPGVVSAARGALAGHEALFTFADGAFDAVIANYMLYHVPDRPRAFAEIARVLRPGGRLFATTNGPDNLREL